MLIDELMEEIYEYSSLSIRPLILKGSTPVISFGDFTKAEIATLGINPSPLEFVDRRGNLLGMSKKRLTDLEALGLNSGDYFLSRNKTEEIWRGCQEYFLDCKNPYWGWFGPLEELLVQSGKSYKNGSACHLDLSPIATKQIYSKLDVADRFILVTNSRTTLNKQLVNSKIKTVIFNGLTVFQTLQFAQNVDWHPLELITYKCNGRDLTSSLHMGESGTGQIYLGWTVNIQAFRGIKKERDDLLSRLSDWVQKKS